LASLFRGESEVLPREIMRWREIADAFSGSFGDLLRCDGLS